MKEYLYHPWCSLKGMGSTYEQSLLSAFGKLGLRLMGIPDWNCSGATAHLSVDEDMALVLGARNPAIAEKSDGKDIVAPCSECFLILTKTKETLSKYPDQ